MHASADWSNKQSEGDAEKTDFMMIHITIKQVIQISLMLE